jgi:hypothetical protein
LYGYQAYFSLTAAGGGRSKIGPEVPTTTYQSFISMDTAIDPSIYKFIVIYTKSALGEQTTPSAIPFVDHAEPVQSITFPDVDLDEGDLAGTLWWAPPSDFTQVTNFVVYFGDREPGNASTPVFTNLSYFGNTTDGEDLVTIPGYVPKTSPGVSLGKPLVQDFTTYGTSGSLSSTTGNASIVTITSAILGGLGIDSGVPRSGVIVARTSESDHTPSTSSRKWFVCTIDYLYFKLVELEVTSVNGELFLSAIGAWYKRGYLQMSPGKPNEWSDEQIYAEANKIFLTMDTDGTTPVATSATASGYAVTGLTYSKVQNLGTLTYANGRAAYMSIPVPCSTFKLSTHFLIFMRSSVGEQTTPSYHLITDDFASVSGMEFVDKDVDINELGGIVYWVQPVDVSDTISYAMYLASHASGSAEAKRTQLGADVLLGTNEGVTPADTKTLAYTHFAVYTRSTLCEQTTPVDLFFFDYEAKLPSVKLVITFTLEGLDYTTLTANTSALGDMQLTIANATALALGYGTTPADCVVAVAAGSVVVSITVTLPPGVDISTAMSLISLSDLIANILSNLKLLPELKAAITGTLGITGFKLSTGGVLFEDYDLDFSDLGGTMTWEPPPDTSQVTHYLIYFAESSDASNRELLGNTTVGTHEILVSVNTRIRNFTHLVLFAMSSLAESSAFTPLPLVDVASTVSSIYFIDQDHDSFHLGGPVWWTPNNVTKVVSHWMYLSTTPDGEWLSQIGSEKAVGTNEHFLPVNTWQKNIVRLSFQLPGGVHEVFFDGAVNAVLLLPC